MTILEIWNAFAQGLVQKFQAITDFSMVGSEFSMVGYEISVVVNDFSMVGNEFCVVGSDFLMVNSNFSVVVNDFYVVVNGFLMICCDILTSLKMSEGHFLHAPSLFRYCPLSGLWTSAACGTSSDLIASVCSFCSACPVLDTGSVQTLQSGLLQS